MAYYGGQQPWDNGPSSGMRASDADRERAVDVLKAGFSEGRLAREEYEQRIGMAYRSRTYGELASLIRDLPQGPVPPMQLQPQIAVPQGIPVVTPAFLPVPVRPANGLAVASLLCGIAGTILAVPSVAAIVLGHRAHEQIRRSGESGESTATAGLALGYLGLAFWAMVLTVALSS